MTSRCGGGTSGPVFGTAAVVDYSAGYIAAVFAVLDIAWLVPIIPFVGLAPLVLNTFCGTDPPAMPSFTAAEAKALLALDFSPDFFTGLPKCSDLILNVLWDQNCHCTSGALVPPVYPTPPVGVPVTQLPTAPTATPCKTFASHLAHSLGMSSTFNGWDLFPGYAATAAVVTATGTPTAGGGTRVSILVSTTDQDGAELTGNKEQAFTVPASGTSSLTIGLPPGTFGLEFDLTSFVDGGQSDVSWHTDVYCGVAPGGTVTPCCPPDVATQSYLDSILRMVTLIQRQNVPFAYIKSTVHAGLSGNGAIAVSGLVGSLLQMTSIPAFVGQESGDPNEFFEAGWFSWGNADGYSPRTRITHSPQISLPADAGVYTSIGYSLTPGVVATITELTREP